MAFLFMIDLMDENLRLIIIDAPMLLKKNSEVFAQLQKIWICYNT